MALDDLDAVNPVAAPPKPPTPPGKGKGSPLLSDVVIGPENYRRKRSKRSNQEISVKDLSDNPRMAADILVMLSEQVAPSASPFAAFSSGFKNIPDQQETVVRPQGEAYLHECSVCHKKFKSHQALGGHKASHRKFATAAPVPEDSNRPVPVPVPAAAKNSNISVLNPSGKLHVCKVCSMSFPSGQALGGHQRRHYIADGGHLHISPTPVAKVTATLTLTATASGVTSSEGGASSTQTPRIMLDLNEPPGLELRLGWDPNPPTPATEKKSQIWDDHEVESPVPKKKKKKEPCELGGRNFLSL